ncbi:hypothetical protein SLA2020_362130 [Shorea laevis]
MVPTISSSPSDIAPSVAPPPASLSLPSLHTSLSSASKSGSSLPSLPLVSNADVIPNVSFVPMASPNGLNHSTSTSQKSPHANHAPITLPPVNHSPNTTPHVMLTKQGHETMPTTEPLGPTTSSSQSPSPNTQSPSPSKSSLTTILGTNDSSTSSTISSPPPNNPHDHPIPT